MSRILKCLIKHYAIISEFLIMGDSHIRLLQTAMPEVSSALGRRETTQ